MNTSCMLDTAPSPRSATIFTPMKCSDMSLKAKMFNPRFFERRIILVKTRRA